MTSAALVEAGVSAAIACVDAGVKCFEMGACDSCCIPKDKLPKTEKGLKTLLEKHEIKLKETETEFKQVDQDFTQDATVKVSKFVDKLCKTHKTKKEKLAAQHSQLKGVVSQIQTELKNIKKTKEAKPAIKGEPKRKENSQATKKPKKKPKLR